MFLTFSDPVAERLMQQKFLDGKPPSSPPFKSGTTSQGGWIFSPVAFQGWGFPCGSPITCLFLDWYGELSWGSSSQAALQIASESCRICKT